jgi:hypothetical protein
MGSFGFAQDDKGVDRMTQGGYGTSGGRGNNFSFSLLMNYIAQISIYERVLW